MNSRTRNILLGIVAILILSFFSGIRVGHPHAGLKNGLGTAETGLVIYKKSEATQAGSKVLVNFSKPHKSPVLGIITANTKDAIAIQTGNSTETIKKDQIVGKLILMVPFFGTVLNWIGL